MVEGALLGLLAITPALPYVVGLAVQSVPRFSMFGDFAILELATRLVRNGHTLFGPYSRFHFSHPGPAYFYVMAVIYEFCGRHSAGLFAGAMIVNLTAAFTTVFALRVLASRAHAVAAAVVLLAWVGAFGNILFNPWNPLVVALPFVAYVVLAALFAEGATVAACPAAFFGAFIAQSHVATVITFVAVGAVASVAFGVRRRRDLSRRDYRLLAATLGVLVVMFLPVVIEQCTSRQGNLTKLLLFFLHPPDPARPLSTGLRNWALATSWLPDRLLEASLATDRGVPLPMRWDAVPVAMTPTIVLIALAHVLALGIAGVVARRRNDRVSFALVMFAAGTELLTIPALRAIVGGDFHYLVFWATSASTVGWLGVMSTLTSVAGDVAWPIAVARRRARECVAALTVLGCGLAAASLGLQRAWLAQNSLVPIASAALRDLYGPVLARLRAEKADAIVHLDAGSWGAASVLLLEFAKDGAPAFVDDPDRFVYGWPPPPAPDANLLHVFVSTQADHPLPPAHCFDQTGSRDGIEIAIARSDVRDCH